MSRSCYTEDIDYWDLIRWRGAVASAIRGRRGQAILKEMAVALDAMPEKRLIAQALESQGDVCALGCVGRVRGMALAQIDPEDPDSVAKAFGIAPALAQEIAFINDERQIRITPEERWKIVRKWVAESIKPDAT